MLWMVWEEAWGGEEEGGLKPNQHQINMFQFSKNVQIQGKHKTQFSCAVKPEVVWNKPLETSYSPASF